MALLTSTQAEIALKHLLGKSQTASSATKGPNNEAETLSLINNSNNIWITPISTNPSTSVSNNIAESISANLTLDPTSNGQAFFATYPSGHPLAGQRVINAIPPTYGVGYEAKPYAGASLIPPGDLRDWIYQYQSGVFYQQTSFATPTPTTIQLYVYKGQTLFDIFTGLTISGDISGTTFYGDGSNLTGIVSTDTYITGGTYNNNSITFNSNNNTSFSVSGITGYYVTGMTFNPSNYVLTLKRNDNLPDLTVDLSILTSELTITGGTYNSTTGVATFNNNQGGSFEIGGFLTGMTDTVISAVTFNNNILTIYESDGNSKSVIIDNFSGLTVNGVISGTTFYGDGSNLKNVQSILGEPEDGNYSDGLFSDLTTGTTLGIFADRVNEVLKSLAPSPAPPLSSLNTASTGVGGKMSYNSSALPVGYNSIDGIGNLTLINFDGTYTVTTNRYGIFGSTLTSLTGLLASNVSVGSGSPTPAYPANAFGDADQGTLELYVNDDITPVHTVNLTSFTSGNTLTSGSGFNLSSPTSVKFPMGSNLDLFKYRTGTWILGSSIIRNGWNFVRVIHRIGLTVRSTQYIDFFRDSITTTTSFSNEILNTLSLTGLKYLSGVKYYTGGNVNYGITVNNAYRNSYSNSSTAISYNNNSTNLIVPTSEPLPSSNNDIGKSFSLSKTATIVNSGIRILNGSITLRTTILRTVQPTATSPGATINGLLVDNFGVSSTSLVENFDDELYRLPSNINFDNSNVISGSSWNSLNSISNSGIVGYNNGLLVYNGQLSYPNQNFSTIVYGPESNVNYSTNVTGERTYYRFFVKSGVAGFILNVNGTGTIRSYNYSMSVGSNDIKIDIKLPNGNNLGTGWMDVSQTFATDQWTDGSGCLLSGTFALNTNNSLTVGTRNTSNSGVGDKIIIRIRVPQNWNGSLNTITLT